MQAATEAELLVCTQGGEFCRCQQVLSLIDQLDDDEKMLEEIRSIFKVRHPSGLPALPQCQDWPAERLCPAALAQRVSFVA